MTFLNWIFSQFKGDYWKANDSYKNTVGEGFLERYCRNFGGELDDNMYPFIAKILDLFNPLIGDPNYLQYMSFNAGINSLSGTTSIDQKLIAWAATLYKWKGTTTSYQIIFNLFGLGIIVDEQLPPPPTTYDGDSIIYDGGFFYDHGCAIAITYNIAYYKFSDLCGTYTITDPTVITTLRNLICLVQPIDARLGLLIPTFRVCDSWKPTVTEGVSMHT